MLTCTIVQTRFNKDDTKEDYLTQFSPLKGENHISKLSRTASKGHLWRPSFACLCVIPYNFSYIQSHINSSHSTSRAEFSSAWMYTWRVFVLIPQGLRFSKNKLVKCETYSVYPVSWGNVILWMFFHPGMRGLRVASNPYMYKTCATATENKKNHRLHYVRDAELRGVLFFGLVSSYLTEQSTNRSND